MNHFAFYTLSHSKDPPNPQPNSDALNDCAVLVFGLICKSLICLELPHLSLVGHGFSFSQTAFEVFPCPVYFKYVLPVLSSFPYLMSQNGGCQHVLVSWAFPRIVAVYLSVGVLVPLFLVGPLQSRPCVLQPTWVLPSALCLLLS